MAGFSQGKSPYNLTRYLEIALFLCRFLSTQVHQLSKQNPRALALSWDWVFKSLGVKPPGGNLLKNMAPTGSEDFKLADAYTLVDYITFEKEQPYSLLNCLKYARRHALLSKEDVLSDVVWQQVLSLYQQVEEGEMAKIWPHKALEFYQDLTKKIHLFYGLYSGGLYRSVGFEFLNMGRFLKQLQITTSIVETHIHYILVEQEENTHPLNLLLHYCGAADLYRQAHGSRQVSLRKVLSFIGEDVKAPCSLAFALSQMENSLKNLNMNLKLNPSLSSLLSDIKSVSHESSFSELLKNINIWSQGAETYIVEACHS